MNQEITAMGREDVVHTFPGPDARARVVVTDRITDRIADRLTAQPPEGG